MNLFIQRLKNLVLKPLQASLPRFPEALLSSFLLGILMIINNELSVFNLVLNDINRTLGLFIPLMVTHTLLQERFSLLKPYRWILFGGFFLLAVSFLIFLRIETSSTVEFIRFSNLGYVVLLLPIFIPYLMDREPIETGIVLLFTKVFTSLLYAAVLYLGIFIVLISANVLFSLSLELSIYVNLLIMIATYIFVPLLLGSYPSADDRIELKKDFHIVWQRIFIFVIAPVITVFTILVFIYLLTGLFNADSFESEVYTFSTLVIAFAGISTQVALKPFRNKNRFISWYLKYFHYGLLMVMFGYYVEQMLNLNRFGVTLSVIIQLILGLWPISYSLWVILKHKNATQKGLLMLVGMFAWIAALPGLNAVSITTLLLRQQFYHLLETNDMLTEEQQIINQSLLPAELYDQLYRTVSEMDRLGLSRFPLLPDDYEHPTDFDTTFGFKEQDGTNPIDESLQYNLLNSVLDLSELDYQYLFYVSSLHELKVPGSRLTFATGEMSLNVNLEDFEFALSLTLGEDVITIDLYEDIALVLKEQYDETYETTIPEELKITLTFPEYLVDVWVLNFIAMRLEGYADLNMGFYLGINARND